MDWLRARILLLVTFIGLNAFLAFRLWSHDFQSRRVLTLESKEQLEVVRARLAAVGVNFSGQIPARAPSLSLLRVERTTPAFAQDLLARFGADDLPGPPMAQQTFRAGSDTLMLYPSGLAVLQGPAQPIGTRGAAPSARISRRLAQEFFRTLGGLPSDAQFVGLAPLDEESVRVDFQQVWRGVPFLPAGLSVVVTRSGVDQVQWLWLEPQGERGDPKAVLPASEALLRLAGHLGDRERKSPIVFTRVDLGYYANPPGGAQTWDMAPVWRITLDDGEAVYINAFTGERER